MNGTALLDIAPRQHGPDGNPTVVQEGAQQ